MTNVKIVTFVPASHADEIRNALGAAGAGIIGEYSFCSYSIVGLGRFIPSDKANPHLGTANKLEAAKEERIEVVCDRTEAKNVIKAIRQVHPYEEVVIDIYLLVDEYEL